MTGRRDEPLDPAIAAARGLTPAQRARLIADAKKAAIRWAWAAKTSNAGVIQAIWGGLSDGERAALGADPRRRSRLRGLAPCRGNARRRDA